MLSKPPLDRRLKTLIIGRARNPFDSSVFHNIALIALFAWVGLGADALSSSSYGPEEAFLALGKHTYLAIFVIIGIAITIFVISASYSQIVELFPTGGGGYLVASKLLSPHFGMLSGCALLIDYMLTITISIASGADAVFSFLPAPLHSLKLEFTVLIILILILMNLRGVKESIVPLVPIFALFLITHVFALTYALVRHSMNFPVIAENTISDFHTVTLEMGLTGMLFLILHSYSMGAGTYTGIEAVSNAMPILREPKVQTAKRTMRYMAISLAFMVFGLMSAYILYNVSPESGKTLNAVLFQDIAGEWGNGWGNYFVLVTLISEAALLFVAAQTGFLGGPRVLANMAIDRWVPTKFSTLSDRFVTQNGVIIMGGAAAVLMLFTQGSVRFLVVLYSISVFITFLLSQSGMVRYWWNSRRRIQKWQQKLLISSVGMGLTAFILVSVIVVKFNEGGWITLLMTGGLIGIVIVIKRHYDYTSQLLKKLNTIVADARSSGGIRDIIKRETPARFDPHAKTAVLLVNGFNGLGLHALSSIFKLFGGIYKNFVFVQIGVIDTDVFKGVEEIENLQTKVKKEVEQYVKLIEKYGYHGEAMTSIGTDVVEEIVRLAPNILERFPNAVFFGGQIVFPNGSILSRWLHNYTVFASQRRLYSQGTPFIILPIKVGS